jgi:hypothetical protein
MLRPAHYFCFVAILSCCCLTSANAQLNVLSAGNPAQGWRKSQLASLKQQLGDPSIRGELREELAAQLKWLEAWKPGALTAEALWEKPASIPAPSVEPIIDPDRVAEALRARLFGPEAKPTTRDTTELQKLLAEHSGDIGIRQLHLHWLDQEQYRKTYPDEIADAAIRLVGLLDQLKPVTKEIQAAKAFCLYRRTRALAYREMPEVIKEKPIEDPVKFEASLIGAYNQLVAFSGKGRSEFILVEIRMLRRDHFYGRALNLLTDHSVNIERQWFLKKQRDLLRELGWEAPAKEAAAIYQKAFPEAEDAN